MKITRHFTRPNQDVFGTVEYEKRTSRISNPDGKIVFEMTDAEIPKAWTQLATDIMVSKYFRKAGVPQTDSDGNPKRDEHGNTITGPEKSARQVIHRLAGCWRHWGETHGYFDTTEDAQAFYDELAYMLLTQRCAPNSPQWFNTGLNWAYGITGPAQGHFYCDPITGQLLRSKDAYTHPQPHACQPFKAPVLTPTGPVPIGKIVCEQMIGMEVLDGTDEGNGITRVIAVKENGTKLVFRVILDGGATLEATGDHLVYVLTADGITGRWVRLDSLDRGAELLQSVRDRQAERALETGPLAASFGVAAVAEVHASVIRQLKPAKVRRIEPIGSHTVYDIQTASGQYLSNGIIVHNCFIQSVKDDLVGEGGIMDLWTREARLFKYGSGTGSNFSKVRGDNEPLSGGGKSSGLMSFLKIGDRAAGAIKSGGTTRRAAKMVCLDLDHPDIEQFVNWKVREELKVACLAEGIKHIPADQQALAKKLGMKLDLDFNGESYYTVSGQNSNNSVRIPNSFFKAVENDGDWKLTNRTNGKVAKTVKARDLWEQIAFAAWRCADPGVQYDDTINQWHTCPRSGRINASNPCVTGDTRVLTPGGIWRRIDQMIHLPARVITNLAGQEIHLTEGSFPTSVKDVYELKTAGGYSVKLTADHKVWTKTRGWVVAEKLTTSDFVRLPSRPAAVHEIGEPQDPRFFQLLGLMLSSANPQPTSVWLDACLADTDVADEFTQYIAETWGESQPDSGDNRTGDPRTGDPRTGDPRTGDPRAGGVATAPVRHRRLMSRLKAFIKCDGTGRRLSDEAFTAGLAAQRHLLRGLFTADGIVDDTLELTGPTAELLKDVQLILLGFGVKSAIHTYETRPLEKGVTTGFSPAPRSPEKGVTTGFLPDGDPIKGDPIKGDTHLYADPIKGDTHLYAANLQSGDGGAVPDGAHPDRRTDTTPPDRGFFFNRGTASPRHGLRIDPGSLRLFCKHVGLLPGRKSQALSALAEYAISVSENAGHYDRFASLQHAGREQVFDLTEPVTHSFVAGGITVHNCSEYMFLDDTACNLASLNVLTFFDAETKNFDIEAFRHGVRIWTIVLEISVLMASFPSEEIAALSYRYRTLGLGYANLGAMLMQSGIAYDSDRGRAVCGALSAIMTGESYATSAEMAAQLGAFPGFGENKNDMLRVIRNHRRAAYDVARNAAASEAQGDYEGLDIHPIGIDVRQFNDTDPLTSSRLLHAARDCWDRALSLGQQHGFRNAQVSVIAPTGTIGLLMDCDTTGVEPDFALVKFKKLAGGGYFKIANQSVRPALVNLGYTPDQIHDILRYVMGTITLHDAPHVNWASLKEKGLTADDLAKIETGLPGQFEIGFAFSGWTLGPDVMKRLNFDDADWQSPSFNLLRRLGYTKKQIDAANDVICGRGTVEGAPHLKPEHYSVFDCANKCGKTGTRYIVPAGHIRMMAAAQPFITGAISKTINLPNEATVDEIKQSYQLSWELGLKSNALYRDGSKLSQPLNVKSDEDHEDDDEENVAAAKAEFSKDLTGVAASVATNLGSMKSDNLEPTHIKVIEKIIERIVERPLRRRLPDTRNAITHKFDVAGHEGYITAGLYEDGQPGEVFITMAKEGSTIGGLMDAIATLVSVSLQYGVPVESLVRKFEHVRFEPAGMTRNPEIPMAKSLVDYIFRWLAMEFVPGYRDTNAPQRAAKVPPRPAPAGSPAPSPRPDAVRLDAQSQAHGLSDAQLREVHSPKFQATESHDAAAPGPQLRRSLTVDPVSQQSTEMQADAPGCDVCGSITVRSGTCYKCLNCGNSMGCS
jgi:ribonucleotide reductase alpha subunit